MSLSLRQLEIIRAVSHAGSVTSAASALGISQPAVSMALRDCTAAAGFPLFLRKQGRLQPTAEMRALLGDLDRVFDGIELINRRVGDMRDPTVGSVRIAATPTLADNLLPVAVAQFQRARPRIRIAVQSVDNPGVIGEVAGERVDFGLVLSPLDRLDARTLDLCSAALIAIMPPGHPLAGRDGVGPTDLDPYPLISFSRGLPLGALVEESFRAAGVPRHIAIEINQSSVACALVRAGAGVAVIDPFWLMDARDQGVARVPFRPETMVSAQVLLAKNEPLSRSARLFLAAVRRVAEGVRG